MCKMFSSDLVRIKTFQHNMKGRPFDKNHTLLGYSILYKLRNEKNKNITT